MIGRNKETDFGTLATNIPGIVYRVYLRESKRMAFFNDMLKQMTGYEASELKMGEVCSIDPIIIPEDYSDVIRIVEDAVRENKSFEVVYRIKHKDRSIRYFLERGSPIYGDDKQPEFIDGIILDVTEHKQIDEARQESEDKFRSLVETTSDWIWEVDANGIYTYASPRVRDLLGYEPEEVLGREPFGFMPPDESARIREEFYKIARKREALVGIENVNIRKDGRRVVLETSGVPKLDARGNLLGYRGVDRDITRRKSAEKELRDRDAKLRELAKRLNYHIENSPIAVIEWGPDMRLIRWAGKAERIFGWRADEVLGKRMEDFPWIYKEDEAQVAQVSAELQSGADPQRFSANRNYRKDGSVIHCEWYNSSLVDDSGELQSILSRVLDVTERKRLEEALRKANDELELRVQERTAELKARAEQLSRLSSELTLVEQKERLRFAGILHDNLQQLLIAAKINQELLLNEISDTPKEMAERALDLIKQSIQVTKSLNVELAPPILNFGELSSSLDWLSRWMKENQSFEVKVEYEAPIVLDRKDFTLLLFQSVRELLLNVLKHSGVKSASVKMEHQNGELRIVVSDRGAGFDPESVLQGGDSGRKFGLISIRERLQHMGGRFEVDSAPNMGSVFSLIVPLRDRTK